MPSKEVTRVNNLAKAAYGAMIDHMRAGDTERSRRSAFKFTNLPEDQQGMWRKIAQAVLNQEAQERGG